ncbi:DNA gyrase subunit B [Cutibacterium acnes JCM 18916]|nr:DNA gyrase subunit B [Cutibacterium acnes JCM 18916]
MSQPEMPESVTDGDTPEDLLIDATDHPDGLDSELPPTAVDGSYDAGQITVLEAWRPFVSVPACISALLGSAGCITASMRLSITPSTRRWPVIATPSRLSYSTITGARLPITGEGFPSRSTPSNTSLPSLWY